MKKIVYLSIIALIFFTSVSSSLAGHPLSCDSSFIGIEILRDGCIGEDDDDNTIHHYVETAVNCSNGEISVFAAWGDSLASPAQITNFYKSQGYRVFQNSVGGHIIVIHPSYNNVTLDGVNMQNYSAGVVHKDV